MLQKRFLQSQATLLTKIYLGHEANHTAFILNPVLYFLYFALPVIFLV